ncbi:sugar ABC transporter permease [Mycoplasma sp. CSL10137]|uniref:sugar ABC transporter permease n=1 Tax=unclassified Mycoplasma TaxID=2683645 RepID=UPI00197B2086|nr:MULTISPECIES: sugar ABC transporter permease [unclassified Mycoplasma]MBN4083599.1 sugar ABC transporter permease [Mycoplasma sp. CSL10137]MBN4084120.1 sugar ABC transporter permease [Mycoplasma sp. CSL10166]MBU4693182.1 sugar ABC transporter permease [Mycoplasma sp. CSL7491-lung]MCU4706562.1 sugar ABC transporter permease [Mycoplasma sp. CSL7503-lung]
MFSRKRIYSHIFDDIKVNNKKLDKKRLNFNESDSKPPTTMEIIWLFFNYLILIVWAIIVLFPIVSLIISAFNINNPRIIAITPFKFGWENFTYLFTSEQSYFGRWYFNTILIAVLTMVISTIAVALNGYAYSRFKFAGSKHSLTVIMMLQMIPATSALISLYLLIRMGNSLGFPTIFMLILIYAGGSISGNTFMLKSYLDTVSSELDDSAKVDGCNNWGLFFKILVPVIRPALIMVALWSFLIPFTDVILPKFVLFELKNTTLAVGLSYFIDTEPKHVNAGAYAAGSILASAPAFVLFMYLQRYIVGGLSDGAVKG